MPRCHIQVSGRVQAVGFRYFSRRAALKLGLSGWVRNLENGNVELEAEGPAEKLDVFITQMKKGPRFARVEHIQVDPVEPDGSGTFEIRS